MRRGTRILLGVAVAAITFFTLRATMGPRYYGSWGSRDGGHCGWYDNDRNHAENTSDEIDNEY